MNAEIACARLASVPKEIRDQMMRHRRELPAGAVTVVARFFKAMTERGEHISAPSQQSFLGSCGSESTLGLLLRVLGQHATSVGLAEGRALRQAASMMARPRFSAKRYQASPATTWASPMTAMLGGGSAHGASEIHTRHPLPCTDRGALTDGFSSRGAASHSVLPSIDTVATRCACPMPPPGDRARVHGQQVTEAVKVFPTDRSFRVVRLPGTTG